jgi:branched-chain amino acid transport system permease protein
MSDTALRVRRGAWSKLGLAFLVAVLIVLPLSGLLGHYALYVMTLITIYGCVVTGLTLFMGYTGQLSIGQAAFYGIGGYTAANLTKLHTPFPLALLLAALASGACGYIVGYVALRLRGFYLAVTTLAVGLIAYQVFKNFDAFTGGVSGLGRIPAPTIGPINIATPAAYFYFCATMLLLVMVSAAALVRSPAGRAMRAISTNELAAQSVGINTYWVKIHVFALSALYAGIAGSLYAHLIRYITPDDFSFVYSVLFLTMAIVGGLGHVFGGLIGAVVATLAAEELRAFPKLQPILFGGVLMVIVMFMPFGLAGAIERLQDFACGRIVRLRGKVTSKARSA